MGATVIGFLSTFVGGIVLLPFVPFQQAAPPGVSNAGQAATVWDGAYTSAQATRGQHTFDIYCRNCHRGFTGETFFNRWREDHVSSLFNFIRTSMPMGSPGSATQAEYLDIVAWVLSTNGFPAGSQELTADSASKIMIVGKNGPAEVPDGSLVKLTGCLEMLPDGSWKLSHAGSPVRTQDVDDSTADSPALPDVSSGPHVNTFQLPDVDFYKPQQYRGTTVSITGFLDKRKTGDRLLATSLKSVSPSCEP